MLQYTAHIAAYYDWLYNGGRGVTTPRERNTYAALQFEYSQGAKCERFAARFFRY